MSLCPENFDHYDRALADDPFPTLREMREQCPVAHSDKHGGFWALTSYEAVYAAAHDHETYSSARGRITIPSATVPGEDDRRAVPIEMDPPDHRKYRALVMPYFSPQRVSEMEPDIRRLARELIDGFIETGKADLAQDYAIPMPMYIICGMLGIASDRWREFRDWIEKILMLGEDPKAAMEAVMHVGGYLIGVLADRRENPQDDLLSYLAHAEVEGVRMSDEDLLGFALLLFGAGAETTTNSIGNTLTYLGRHPDVRQRLVEDPSLLDNAIEEFLRYDSPVFGLARTATADAELIGQHISKGDRLLLMWSAANHDQREFANADEVDIERFPNRHLAFGSGIHRCIGSHLARLELKVALQEILGRVPNYEINEAGVERSIGTTRGTRNLPVSFPVPSAV